MIRDIRPIAAGVMLLALGGLGCNLFIGVPRDVSCGFTLSIVGGDGQSGEIGTALPADLVLEVRYSAGTAQCSNSTVAGETVRWSATSGSVPQSSVTNAQGITNVRWTLGNQLGAQTVTAAIYNIDGTRVLGSTSFGATALSAPYRVLRKVAGDGQGAAAGQLLPVGPLVELRLVREAGPQLPKQETPIQFGFVFWTVSAGGGAVDPSATVTGADGRTTSQWRVGPAPGVNQLQVDAQSAAAPPDPRDTLQVSFSAVAGAAPVDHVDVTPPQASLTVGQPALQLTARAFDPGGVELSGRTFTWSSTDNAIASVSQTGLVTPNAPGRATIRALETVSQAVGTAVVDVVAAPRIRVLVSGAGGGNGRVTSSGLPNGDVSCTSTAGVTSGACDRSFDDSDGMGSVTLTASADPGSGFSGYTGCSSTTGGSCLLNYNSTSGVTFAVTARFDLVAGGTELLAFESDRSGDDEIYAVKPDGTGLTRLTVNAAADREPAWSPDGSKLAFVSDRTGDFEIYVMNADGSGVVKLTADPAVDREPSWSPDGQRIVFWSERDLNREIYVINANGSGLQRLTTDPSADEDAVWAPDGRIVFASSRGGGFVQLYVMNGDGTGVQRLSFSSADDEEPGVSPDGTRIVFTRTPLNGTEDLYAMNLDGTNLVRLTNNGVTDSDPVWSPTGARIAFMTNRDGAEEVYLMNADGSGLVRLTNGGGTNSGSPAWVRRP